MLEKVTFRGLGQNDPKFSLDDYYGSTAGFTMNFWDPRESLWICIGIHEADLGVFQNDTQKGAAFGHDSYAFTTTMHFTRIWGFHEDCIVMHSKSS